MKSQNYFKKMSIILQQIAKHFKALAAEFRGEELWLELEPTDANLTCQWIKSMYSKEFAIAKIKEDIAP